MDQVTWTVFRPLGTRALIKLDAKRDRVGSLFIPETFAKQPESAVVIAVGKRCPPELQPGVRCVVGKFNGHELPPPVHDPLGEYRVVECDHAQPVPHVPDLYLIVDDVAPDDDVRERVSRDLHPVSIDRRGPTRLGPESRG